MKKTVWVLGDQLDRTLGALGEETPDTARVLMVESDAMLSGRPYHRQRLHLVLAAMRRFASELETEGFDIDYRRAASLADAHGAHCDEHDPAAIVATEPNGRGVADRLESLGVGFVRSTQFLCHKDDFAEWADGRSRLRLEDFYRWQRRRLGYLMDGDEPAGGAWNFDKDNREPPPKDGGSWPEPLSDELDALDDEIISEIGPDNPGADPVGWWATTRSGALRRLDHFIERVLPDFGPYEDAMLADNWHLAHSTLSPYLNLGLLRPDEICDRVEEAYRSGDVPINSAEGMIRQLIGWREFVWGIYWLWPEQWDTNVLDNDRPLPPAWLGTATTDLRCVATTLADLEERGWIHHIQRLMVLANFANLYGIDPVAVRNWMRERFVDGAQWVMGPNVMGMGMWADGGRMSTKPYVSGGAYIKRMSDYCGECRFNPSKRTGPDACPFTTLYWDFMARHRELLGSNARMARQYATLDRLKDREELADRAAEVIEGIDSGAL